MHVTQLKKERKNKFFPISFPKLYLRQGKVISAKVKFHGCFKSFNATYGNILKVLLSYIYFNQYLQYEGGGGDAREIRKHTTSLAVTNCCRKINATISKTLKTRDESFLFF